MNATNAITSKYYRHLTPLGEGGISSFLIVGQDSFDFIATYFKNFNSTKPSKENNRFYYGKLFNQQNQLIDEIILCLKNDKTIEFHSHGGFSATREIIKLLEAIEFQKMPHAVYQQINHFYHYEQALLATTTQHEFEYLVAQINNYLQIKPQIKSLTTTEQINLLHAMVAEWKTEKYNRRRVSVCLAGLPNAGKSSLINAITGKKRALVSNIAKTTRDTLTENVLIKGCRFQFMDTAGLHNPDNSLDQESVNQSLANIARAEIVFWLHDHAIIFSEEELAFLEIVRNKCKDKPIWLILTKEDIKSELSVSYPQHLFHHTQLISCPTRFGIDLLLSDLIQLLFPRRQEPLPLAAISDQMSNEIIYFLQKVDLLPAKHKMVREFTEQILSSITLAGNNKNDNK